MLLRLKNLVLGSAYRPARRRGARSWGLPEQLEIRQFPAVAGIDLVAVSIANLPANAENGGTFNATITVRNNGTQRVNGFTVGFGLSIGRDTRPEYVLATEITRGSLAAGATQTWTQAIRVARYDGGILPNTNYYVTLGIQVQGREPSANNFTVSAGRIGITPRPGPSDLIAGSIDAPSEVAAGDRVRIPFSFRNGGQANTPRSFLYRYELVDSNNNTQILLESTVPELRARQTHQGNPFVNIPSNLRDGNYRIRLVVDATNSVTESSESNNIVSDTFRVRTPSRPIDLPITNDRGSATGSVSVRAERDLYRITLDRPVDLTVTMNRTSSSLDPYLRLLDAHQRQIMANDDSNDTLNSQISIRLIEGTYYLSAGAFNDASTGEYLLDVAVRDFSDHVNEPGPLATFVPILNGQATVGGVLQQAGDRDTYQIQITETTRLRIDLARSPDNPNFDAYLRVQNVSGSQNWSNDDANGSFNSQLTLTLTAGTYYITAGAFSDDSAGNYDLSLSVV
jgi:hypothetical protein